MRGNRCEGSKSVEERPDDRERNRFALGRGGRSLEALEDYLSPEYRNGSRAPSQFEQDFHLQPFDEDGREAEIFDQKLDRLSDLLAGFSYDEVIIPRFTEAFGNRVEPPANAVVLLYRYKQDWCETSRSGQAVALSFIGAVSYW
jgi:hypothetical protein